MQPRNPFVCEHSATSTSSKLPPPSNLSKKLSPSFPAGHSSLSAPAYRPSSSRPPCSRAKKLSSRPPRCVFLRDLNHQRSQPHSLFAKCYVSVRMAEPRARVIVDIFFVAIPRRSRRALTVPAHEVVADAFNWGVVQLVGHLTVNEDGEGSNPSAPANFPSEKGGLVEPSSTFR
jgi:hypothetical protein